jgi:hypothetical protein
MPYKSIAQQHWAHTPAGEAALGGPGKVHEWDTATSAMPGGYSGLPLKVNRPDVRAHVLANMMERPSGFSAPQKILYT